MEPDEGFFSIELPDEEKDKPLKRGRGSQKKAKVLVMVESPPSEEESKLGRPSRKVGHLKMQVIPDLITDIVGEQLEPSVELTTDDSTSYINFDKHIQNHQAVTADKNTIKTFLPWVHIAISNTKRLLPDVHHRLKAEYLQYYLHEFCYKFNRRHFGEKLFDRLVVAAISYNTDLKSRIYNRTAYG